MKMKYIRMMNIDEHKTLQGFQGTHVKERTLTLQGPFIEDWSNFKLKPERRAIKFKAWFFFGEVMGVNRVHSNTEFRKAVSSCLPYDRNILHSGVVFKQ